MLRTRVSTLPLTAAFVLGLPAALIAQPRDFSVSQAGPGTHVVHRDRVTKNGAEVALEGFVVDADALVATLRTRVLEQQGLGNLARVASVHEDARPTRKLPLDLDSPSFAHAYTFKHRFAHPFAAVEARLLLAPLDDEGAFDLLYQLSALVVLSVVVGLYALYRMAAVQVRFAEQRSNFVAAVSHELKTPLTAIRMYGEMLRDGMVENDQKRNEYYATITSETERLSRLINNVLELSRLEQNDRPVQLVAADLGRAVAEVVAVFRPHAEQAGFTIVFSSQAALPHARFDRDALTQVLFNVLDNALKYAQGSGPRELRVRCERAAHGGVRVRVQDSGPGVPADQLAAIFAPFYRVQSELTRTQKGTGIGLSLVKGLVERMQGSVVATNLEPGFEVCVTLLAAST
ncbi:MAG: hypothetical protein RL701_1728 [Pseudomonadota bacterium]|jgi:signal transduction histidine kinase